MGSSLSSSCLGSPVTIDFGIAGIPKAKQVSLTRRRRAWDDSETQVPGEQMGDSRSLKRTNPTLKSLNPAVVVSPFKTQNRALLSCLQMVPRWSILDNPARN